MQLSHAGDDRLSGFLVRRHPERGVFLGQLGERDAHLFLVGLGPRLDGHGDHGLGELHSFQRDRLLDVAERIAGGHILQADGGGDIARVHFLDLLAIVRVHLQDAADAFLPVLDRVVDRVARVQHAGIDTEEDQIAHERVRRDLECERGERLVVGRMALAFRLVLVDALDRGHVYRRRHELDDAVEQGLHTLVLECRAAHRHDDLVRERA